MNKLALAVGSLPDLWQLARDNRVATSQFDGMTDEQVLVWSATLDRRMGQRYLSLGADDTGRMLLRRADAIENLLRRAGGLPDAGRAGQEVRGE